MWVNYDKYLDRVQWVEVNYISHGTFLFFFFFFVVGINFTDGGLGLHLWRERIRTLQISILKKERM